MVGCFIQKKKLCRDRELNKFGTVLIKIDLLYWANARVNFLHTRDSESKHNPTVENENASLFGKLPNWVSNTDILLSSAARQKKDLFVVCRKLHIAGCSRRCHNPLATHIFRGEAKSC